MDPLQAFKRYLKGFYRAFNKLFKGLLSTKCSLFLTMVYAEGCVPERGDCFDVEAGKATQIGDDDEHDLQGSRSTFEADT